MPPISLVCTIWQFCFVNQHRHHQHQRRHHQQHSHHNIGYNNRRGNHLNEPMINWPLGAHLLRGSSYRNSAGLYTPGRLSIAVPEMAPDELAEKCKLRPFTACM